MLVWGLILIALLILDLCRQNQSCCYIMVDSNFLQCNTTFLTDIPFNNSKSYILSIKVLLTRNSKGPTCHFKILEPLYDWRFSFKTKLPPIYDIVFISIHNPVRPDSPMSDDAMCTHCWHLPHVCEMLRCQPMTTHATLHCTALLRWQHLKTSSHWSWSSAS